MIPLGRLTRRRQPLAAVQLLVPVVGKRGRNVSEDEALGCLLGLTLCNDLSERAWQRFDRTLWRAKNTDTFEPMGSSSPPASIRCSGTSWSGSTARWSRNTTRER
jgi:hypothetical protein